MSCSGRLGSSWGFASFWCVAPVLSNIDDGVGAGHSPLVDSMADFPKGGVRANVGMVLYNVTLGTNGRVTAVTDTTITATGVVWNVGDEYRIVPIDSNEIATINRYLDVASNDVHAALSASGQCNCTQAAWATAYLEKLTIIDAVAYYRCECGQPQLTDETRRMYLEWMNTQFDNIRQSKVDICGGTGAEFPAIGWAEQGVTEFATEQILFNAWRRSAP